MIQWRKKEVDSSAHCICPRRGRRIVLKRGCRSNDIPLIVQTLGEEWVAVADDPVEEEGGERAQQQPRVEPKDHERGSARAVRGTNLVGNGLLWLEY